MLLASVDVNKPAEFFTGGRVVCFLAAVNDPIFRFESEAPSRTRE
jgi:hypothetical protein